MIKTVALVFFVLTSLALGAWSVFQSRQIAQRHVEIGALNERISHQDQEMAKMKAASADLEQKRAQLAARNKAAKQALADAQSNLAATAASSPAANASPTPAGGDGKKKKSANPFADSITKMMKDPAMKNMMRANQATALRQMYGDLVKQWSLSPDETQTFYDLLLDKQMDQMDQGMALLDKGPDAAKSADLPDLTPSKASLGDNLYKQYQDYEKTLSGRFAVNQFQQQLANSNTPALTSGQSAMLLQAVTEESASVPPSGMFGKASGANGASFSMDPAQVDQYMKAQGDLNDRIDARMANTLSADQLRVLTEQQQQMLATQRLGMEMAAKMMGPSPTP